MATQLIQIVTFNNVLAGAQVALPHNINVNGRRFVPDFVTRDNASFTIDAVTDTTVTVTNTSGAPASCNVYLRFDHSEQRWFGARGIEQLVPAPFIPAVGGGGGSIPATITNMIGALVRLQWQLAGGNNAVLAGGGTPTSSGGRAIAGAGPHNNLAPDVNGGDPNTFGAPYWPLIVEGDADATVTGAVSADVGAPGWTSFTPDPAPFGTGALIISNVMSANSTTIVHESAASVAANRFSLPGAANLVLPPLSLALFLYDTGIGRWTLIAPSY